MSRLLTDRNYLRQLSNKELAEWARTELEIVLAERMTGRRYFQRRNDLQQENSK